MKWSILILTMPDREDLLGRLLDCLRPQVAPYPFPDIEVLVKASTPGKSIGEQRQELLDKAKGEYVNFIDDDDMVPPNYVESIYPLLDGVDYVGFPVHVFRNGKFFRWAFHSLIHKSWRSYDFMDVRDISHLNPMRKELAIQGRMEGDFAEDIRWATRLRELGIVKTEHYITEPMYFYHPRAYA